MDVRAEALDQCCILEKSKRTSARSFFSRGRRLFQERCRRVAGSVTGTRCICFQLASTSSVSGRLHVPLLSGESGVWWTRACMSLHSGLETLAFGQVSQPVSINAVINSVSDVSGILYGLCCRMQSHWQPYCCVTSSDADWWIAVEPLSARRSNTEKVTISHL